MKKRHLQLFANFSDRFSSAIADILIICSKNKQVSYFSDGKASVVTCKKYKPKPICPMNSIRQPNNTACTFRIVLYNIQIQFPKLNITR